MSNYNRKLRYLRMRSQLCGNGLNTRIKRAINFDDDGNKINSNCDCDCKDDKSSCIKQPKCYGNKNGNLSPLRMGHSEKQIFLIKRLYPQFRTESTTTGTRHIHYNDSRSYAIQKKALDTIVRSTSNNKSTNIDDDDALLNNNNNNNDCFDGKVIYTVGNGTCCARTSLEYQRLSYNNKCVKEPVKVNGNSLPESKVQS